MHYFFEQFYERNFETLEKIWLFLIRNQLITMCLSIIELCRVELRWATALRTDMCMIVRSVERVTMESCVAGFIESP